MARDVSSLRPARARVRLSDFSRSELIRYAEELEAKLYGSTPPPCCAGRPYRHSTDCPNYAGPNLA